MLKKIKSELIDLKFFNTYFYANFIDNLLSSPFTYIRTLHDLFENDGHLNFISPFPKFSALHRFIWFCLELDFSDDLDSEFVQESIKRGKPKLPINYAFESFNIKHTTFEEWLSDKGISNQLSFQSAVEIENLLFEYLSDLILEEAYHHLLETITDEVFFLMFPNRQVLYNLNSLVTMYISDVDTSDLDSAAKQFFSRNGVLKRSSIPEWVKTAVFFRDRGSCANCYKDISGLVSISNKKHFDHVIPLAEGGVNDVTNIQLLCENCNLKKGKTQKPALVRYERWYPI